MKETVWSMDKTLVGTEESVGAVIRMCSVNKDFWKIAENSQENNNVSGIDICNLVKKWLHVTRILQGFKKHLFENSCLWIS